MKGDVSVKLDTFSFGVILLELVTGLSPFDANREHADLLAHVTELLFDASDQSDESSEDDEPRSSRDQSGNRIDRVDHLLDQSVGPWNMNWANALFDLAHKATHERKRKRPSMEQVLRRLNSLTN